VPTDVQTALDLLDADPWVHPLLGQRAGDYVRAHVKAITVDHTLPPGVGARALLSRKEILWQPVADRSVVRAAATLLHEARHFDRNAWHSCGTHDLAGDRSMDEAGPFAIQIVYLEHMGDTYEAQFYRQRYIGC
jgi:hypothetical protein